MRRGLKWLGISVGGFLAFLIVVGIIGAIAGSGSKKAAPKITATKVVSTARLKRAATKGVPTAKPKATATAVPATLAPTNTPQPHYSITASGQIPTNEFVGQPFNLSIEVRNTGSTIQHFTVDVGGCIDHWVLDDIFGIGAVSPSKSAVGDYYDFGIFNSGQRGRVVLRLNPKDAGNHVCDITVYGTVDASSGIPSGDALQSLSANVAINP